MYNCNPPMSCLNGGILFQTNIFKLFFFHLSCYNCNPTMSCLNGGILFQTNIFKLFFFPLLCTLRTTFFFVYPYTAKFKACFKILSWVCRKTASVILLRGVLLSQHHKRPGAFTFFSLQSKNKLNLPIFFIQNSNLVNSYTKQ